MPWKAALFLSAVAGLCLAQDPHHEGVNARGDHEMGFSHQKTTHHFALHKDGGAVLVQADNPDDAASRDLIRMHLEHISKMFAEGDFNAPMLIHARNVPGTADMTRLRSQIQYQAKETPRGAELGMRSDNKAAVSAIHKFLRFQIKDHRTGDPLTIQ